MIRTTQDLLLELSEYGTPKTRIQRMVKNGTLVKIRRGLYETDPNVPAYLLAGVVCSPSYISFSYALSHYGLIPERVETCTSAAFGKSRSKLFKTPVGNFSYRDIPKGAYPYGVYWKQEGKYSYLIASPEKAICDMLYIKPPVGNLGALKEMLFEDLRIDENSFYSLEKEKLLKLTERFHTQNIRMLARLIGKGLTFL
ncbi:MAG TPA: hypothetical protein DEP57_02395 [Selenomonas sp.]|nr:hypothetical protein [Selenomonas sp.]